MTVTTPVSVPLSSPTINLDQALEILTDAGNTMARELNQRNATGETQREFSARTAELTRSLLNVADQLVLASSLVRNEYWNVKGQTSYEL